MTGASVFKIEWTLAGINAPALIWVGAAILGVLTLGWLLMLVRRVWRERSVHRRLLAQLQQLASEIHIPPKHGLTAAAYDRVTRVFEGEPALSIPWNAYNAQMLVERSSDGEDEFWWPESAETTFTDSAVIDARLNRSFYLAVPSLVTGLGLLLTFVAILFALLDVRVEHNQVLGLEGLVAGLSGKFVSSVVALFFASIFLLFERPLLHRLTISRHQLVAAVDALMPRRTALGVMSDLHRDIQEQSVAFRHFNSDLSGRMKQSFSESMGPTLQRMVEVIDDLNRLMRVAEAQKQESITGSLTTLLEGLERSMNTSLERMGDQFASALSGSATAQFDELASSLSGTAGLLQDMKAQFQATQGALSSVVDLARNSTAEQLALGKTQVEELTAVLRQLMGQLQETTGTSVQHMTAALTEVVYNLSSKVSNLSEQMTTSVAQSTGQAAAAATHVVDQARTWSEQSAAQLAELLERHSTQTERVDEIRSGLEATLVHVRDILSHFGEASAGLRSTSSEIAAITARAADAVASIKNVQASMQQVADRSATQVDRLAEASRQQGEAWEHVQQQMQEYAQTFEQVDHAAGALLEQIARNLHEYTQTAERAFGKLVEVSNDLIGNAVQRLGSAINELEEQLTELSEALSTAGHSDSRARVG